MCLIFGGVENTALHCKSVEWNVISFFMNAQLASIHCVNDRILGFQPTYGHYYN